MVIVYLSRTKRQQYDRVSIKYPGSSPLGGLPGVSTSILKAKTLTLPFSVASSSVISSRSSLCLH